MDCSLLYHGSLTMRSGVSRGALAYLRQRFNIPAFVDVNLRDPWWNRDDVWHAVESAKWVKLNQSELELLAGSDVDAAVQDLRNEYQLEAVIVTRGGQGALIVAGAGAIASAHPDDVPVVDTVGAGDAFSAMFILGLVTGWEIKTTLQRSVEFAAEICTVTGATVRDRGFYSRFGDKGWW